MLVLPNSLFLHCPKTGGRWVLEAVKAAGIPFEEKKKNETDIHMFAHEVDDYNEGKILFTFVRDPLDWWESYWQFKMGVNWKWENNIDRIVKHADSFDLFCERILNNIPGECSRIFELFTGVENNEIDFVGRYENLVEDFILALTMAGEEFDPEIIRQVSPANVSDKKRFIAEYTPEIALRMTESEQAGIKRYGYV